VPAQLDADSRLVFLDLVDTELGDAVDWLPEQGEQASDNAVGKR
jgi:hypothetical protein